MSANNKVQDERPPEQQQTTMNGEARVQQDTLSHAPPPSGPYFVGAPPPGATIMTVYGGQQGLLPIVHPQMQMTACQTRSLLVMGNAQAVLGSLAILLNTLANIFVVDILYFVVPGYWCGILFIITGTSGVFGGLNKRKSFVVTFCVMSIISAVFSTAILATAIAAIFSYDRCIAHSNTCRMNDAGPFLGIPISFLLCWFVEFVVAIACAAVCGKVIRSQSSSKMTTDPTGNYVNGAPSTNGYVPAAMATHWIPSNAPPAYSAYYPAYPPYQTDPPAAVHPGIAGQTGAGYDGSATVMNAGESNSDCVRVREITTPV